MTDVIEAKARYILNCFADGMEMGYWEAWRTLQYNVKACGRARGDEGVAICEALSQVFLRESERMKENAKEIEAERLNLCAYLNENDVNVDELLTMPAYRAGEDAAYKSILEALRQCVLDEEFCGLLVHYLGKKETGDGKDEGAMGDA